MTISATRAVDVHHEVRDAAPASDGDGTASTATPVVLIHGVGDSTASWEHVTKTLPSDRQVISYDLRGHGASPSPEGPWTIDDFVADHLRLLDRLGIEDADVVGFSLGGLIAQRLAATTPERVRRLVIIGAVAGRTDDEKAAVLDRLALVERDGPLGAALVSVSRWYSADYLVENPHVAEDTIARMSELDPQGYTNAYRVLATTDLHEGLTSITAPTLALTGEHDVGSPPRMARTIASNVADGRVAIIAGSRHSVLRECPEVVAKEITHHVS